MPKSTNRSKVESKARKEAGHFPELNETLTPEEARLMLHELRVHQLELEMQNEELRRVQIELEAMKSVYFDLYDLAPVGYCTLNEKGIITQANLTAATVLGLARNGVIRQLFSRFIPKEDQDTYYLFRKRLMESGAPQFCELRMQKEDGTCFRVHLAATLAKDIDKPSLHHIVMMACNHAG